MADKDDIIELLVEVIDLDAEKKEEFLLFLNNWTHTQFDNEYILNFLHDLDYLPVFKDQSSEKFLHLIHIIFEIKDESHIFTSFILHLMWSLLSLSLINKIKIYSEELINQLIEILIQNRIEFKLQNFVRNILLSLVELGLTTFQLSKIWEARKRSSLISEFIFEALNSYPLISMSTIFQDGNDVISFKDLYLHDPKKGFTISTWFKLNAGVNKLLDPYLSDFNFLSLKDINENEVIRYSVVNNKLELYTNDREQCFESFNFEIGKLYNLSLVHKCDSKRNTRIDLYINGVFVESKITDFLFSNLTDSLSGLISFTTSIGSITKDIQLLLEISGPSTNSNVLLEMSNFTLINDSKRLEWIYFLYFLGPNYSGDYQDSNLTNLISPKHLINLSLQLKEELEHVNSNSSIHNIKLEPTQLIISFNISCHGKTFYNWKSWSPSSDGIVLNKADLPANNKFLFKNHDFLYDVFHSIGGFTDCLSLIEEANSSSGLLMGLNLLFKLLDNHGKLSFEFVSSSGYDVLATLLKTKRSLITLEILDSVLNFIGYNSNSPAESIIGDRLAYKSLIVDFEIWQPFMIKGEFDSSSKDTFKFLLFQLTVFGQDSKYHLFNVKQLADMKIVKRIIHALKQNLVDEDVLPVLQNLLLIIVKCNPTPDVIKTLQFYITYTIVQSRKDGNSKKLQELSGLAVMETLVTLICEILVFEESEKAYRRLLKIISWKWLLSVMQSDLKMKKLALKLLIKLLSVYTSKYYLSFSSFGGFFVITNLLAPFWNDNELLVILFGGAFDLSYTSPDISVHDFFDAIISKNFEIDVKMPHFLIVTNNLMTIAANTVDKEGNENALLALQIYIECLRKSNRRMKNVDRFYNTNIGWMGNFIFLIMIMKKSQCDSLEFNKIRSQYFQFLEEMLIYKLFSNPINSDLAFIENLYGQFKVEFNFTIIPLLTQHIRDFQSTLSTVFNSTNTSITFCRIFILYFQSSCKHEFNSLEYLFHLQIIGMVIMKIVRSLNKNSKVLPYVEKLSNDFGKFYIMMFISCTENELLKPGNSVKELKKCFQILMEYTHILMKSLNEELKVILFSLLYKNIYVDNQELASLSTNCLRVFILEQKDIAPIISHLIIDAENKKQLTEITEKIVSLDDEQLKTQLNLNHEIKRSFNDKFSQSLTLLSKSEFSKSKSKSIVDYIDGKLAPEKSNKILETEINPFSEGIYKSEAKRFNAHLQDSRDDLEYYVELYQSMKANLPDTNMDMTFTLDSTEGRCRRRNKIVTEIEYKNLRKSSDSSLQLTQKQLTSNETEEYDFVSSISDLDLELESFEEDKNRRILRNLYVHDKIDEVFNVTQIRGLETFESVMILGITHVYFIENYFCSTNREILESDEAPEKERDSFVKLLKSNGNNEEEILKNVKTHKSKSWPISKLVSISKRKFLLRDVAFEMFFIDGSSVLVTCITTDKRNTIFNKLFSKINNKLPDVELEEAMKLASQQKIIFNDQERNFSSKFVYSFLSSDSTDVAFSNITKKWKNGKLSNFYYLILINTIAGRTFNDLTQYPIFPFVIADYESKVLDLNDSNTFRDFAKPMGAQTEKRAEQFKERYEASKEMSPDTPPFHYGTHYSSAMIVTSYLIRLKPFTQSYLKIQGGKFDHADRLFNSIQKLWNSASKDNTTDVRELIPEFYYLPEFLINSNNYEFGKSQDGTIVNDVELPPWANNDPVLFVHLMRKALESDYVSAHLNKWIDLTFGFKQQGEKAIESLNVFHYLSYPGSINLDNVIDNHEKAVITSIIHNFGQTPLQIFKKPHPEKNVKIKKLSSNIEKLIGLPINDNFEIKENRKYKNKKLINKKFKVNKIIFDFSVKRFIGLPWNIDMNEKLNVIINGNSSIIINNRVIFEELCIGSKITALEVFKDGTGRFIIGFKNGYMNIYQLSSDRWTNVTNSQRSSVVYGMEHSHDYKNNNNKLLLLNTGVLRGHFSSIVSIKHNSYDNVLVSLDVSGSLKIWRIDNIFRMKTLSDCGVKKFDIDKELGYILSVDVEGIIKLWTINGKLICENSVGDNNNKVSNICFAEVNLNGFIEINNSPWDHFIIFGICYEYGKIEVFKIEYNVLKWEFDKIKTMEYEGNINCMRIKLDVGIDGNGVNTGRCKIITGDNNGEIFIWN